MSDPGNYPSLTKCYLDAIDQHPNARAQVYRSADGWQAHSSAEMLRRVAGLAKALAALGVQAGDRVGIFAANCAEWHIADFAVLGLGAIDVPIYYNESPERLQYIWNDAEVKVAIVAGESQARKLAASREKIPTLREIVAVTAPPDLRSSFLDYATLISAVNDSDIVSYRARAALVKPEQLATLIYTSGTTGEPKGVMLTHANLTSNCIDTTCTFEYFPDDVALSFLPLSHVYERMFDYSHLFHGISVAYLDKIEDAARALLEVHPTITAGVPRVFEKTYASILEKGHQETGIKRKIFDWALRVAADAVPWRAYDKPSSAGLRLRWSIADKIVYAKVRQGLGGRVRMFFSGGAPLAKDLEEIFWSFGVPIYQGYGQTESSPVISTNMPGQRKVGTVGRPIRNVEVRIAEDGEILAHGPCVMQGYYRKAEATAEALTPDRWLRTGDIGHLDEDGYLVITDRKKELLKTAAGKFVAPAPIENKLKVSPYIANAMVVGDKRKFVSVLIVPNFATIESKARAEGKDIGPGPDAIAVNPWVRDLISMEMERLTSDLPQYEKPKRFALLAKDFTFANGELTYTLKLKRRIVEERYRDAIAQLYADVEEPHPQVRH
ncbi:MAG: long-chain fatty acid--CoA ligase [Candidatus Acidiferrales bacterium]